MGTVIWIMVAFPDAERVYPNRHEVGKIVYEIKITGKGQNVENHFIESQKKNIENHFIESQKKNIENHFIESQKKNIESIFRTSKVFWATTYGVLPICSKACGGLG